jgi:DMSO/TMAO reductase YedYZ molybdopterin-dependent catalytic subunit
MCSTAGAGSRGGSSIGGRLPSADALDDVLLAHEMNGEQLPYDHSYPARGLTPTPRDLGIPAQPCLSYAP